MLFLSPLENTLLKWESNLDHYMWTKTKAQTFLGEAKTANNHYYQSPKLKF